MLLFVACTSDEEERALHTEVLQIPLAVCEAPSTPIATTETRSTGDPGIRENLPAPRFLYIWLTEGDRVLHYEKKSDIDASAWTRKNTHDRWDYTYSVELPEGVTLTDGATVQVYAIAAQHELPDDAGFSTSYATTAALNAAIFDLSSWQNDATATHTTTAAAHSWALGNLYSTPLALMAGGNADASAAHIADADLHNGTYTARKVGTTISLVENRPTRLYHCAAKADFKWEVPTALQPMVSVSTITVKGLPTRLKVFEPTHNPTGDGSCPLLAASDAVNALTLGNKWIGREYAYVLQPPTTTANTDGILYYDVTFTGGHTAVSDKSTSSATNPVFTTWYRINANIR